MPLPTLLPDEVRFALAPGGGLATRDVLERVGSMCADLKAWCTAGLIERVTRGVCAEALLGARREDTYRRFVVAGLLARDGRDTVVTGPSVLVLHGFPLLGTLPAVVHALAPHAHGSRAVDRVQVIGPAEPDEYQWHGTWHVATPARAVLDCARVFGVAAAVAAADVALRGGHTADDQLALICGRMSGRKGVDRARRALRVADRQAASPGESWSAVVIDALGHPAPARQHDIRDGDGLLGRCDFWWPDHRVVGGFVGRVKYGRANPAGRSPEDVLWAEKRREDACVPPMWTR